MVVQKVTEAYAAEVARTAYLWGWPLVNLHNRRVFMEQLPGPGLLTGIVPAGPPNRIGMLHDYIRPEERVVACPNQDVAYGFGPLDAERGPAERDGHRLSGGRLRHGHGGHERRQHYPTGHEGCYSTTMS